MKQSFRHTVSHLRKKKCKYIHASAVVLVLGCIAIGAFYFHGRTTSAKPEFVDRGSTEPISIVLAGDVMMDRGVERNIIRRHSGDYGALFANASYLKNADIAFLNLEGPVADESIGTLVGSRFSFRMNPKSITAMQNAGVDVVSFANNHVGDYGQDAFTETMRLLRAAGIRFAGAGVNRDAVLQPEILNVRGVRIGFMAASDVGPSWVKATKKPGMLVSQDSDFLKSITTAKESVDILIVSMHWGDEYSPVSAHQEKLAKQIADAGADVIVGAHPHVMQRVDTYNDSTIFYSLGNYIFDQYFSPHTMRGMVAFLSIDPQTKTISRELMVSPLSKDFIPQALVPFDESMLITKPFTP